MATPPQLYIAASPFWKFWQSDMMVAEQPAVEWDRLKCGIYYGKTDDRHITADAGCIAYGGVEAFNEVNQIVKDLINVMKIQEEREAGEFCINKAKFVPMWNNAIAKAKKYLEEME